MTIHQLSIFVENQHGTLLRVLDILKEAGIQLVASTIADTQEYGIFRVLCSEPTRAYIILKEAGINVALTDVLAIELDNQPGRAADAIRVLSDAGVSIKYMYTFLLRGKGVMIFRADPCEKAKEAIILHKLNFIAEADLSKLV
ncbi:MAG: amino acid-binding protein [Bacteroidales bacterium]|nr:amino acid-binding protein [Bacteroidales bacterium]